MITEDYVSLGTAKLLKEKGFDCSCKVWYSEYTSQFGGEKYTGIEFDNHNRFNENYKFICSAPTIQMAMKWLREKHHLHIEIRITNHSMSDMINVVKYYWVMANTETGKWCDESTIYTVKAFDNSYEAEEDAIKHALEKMD